MIQIPREKILERYDSLPDKLKEASFSEQNVFLLQQIYDQHHLSEGKGFTISRLIGLVLFGFIQPEDLAKEILDELDINPEIAKSIASEVDRKVFSPIKTDLEKVYAPIPGQYSKLVSVMPLIPEGVAFSVSAEPLKIPSTLSEDTINLKVPSPTVATATIQKTEKPFVFRGAMPSFAQPAPSQVKPQEPEPGPEEGPKIIHEELQLKPIAGGESKRSLGGLLGMFSSRPKTEEAPKPFVSPPVSAELKLGKEFKTSPTPPPTISQTEAPKIKIVHYSEFGAQKSPFGETAGPEPVAPLPPKAQAPIFPPAPTFPSAIRIEPKIEIRTPGEAQIQPLEGTPGINININVKQPEPETKKTIETIRPIETIKSESVTIKGPVVVESTVPIRAQAPVSFPQPVSAAPLVPKIEEIKSRFGIESPQIPAKPPEPDERDPKKETIIDLRTFEILKKNNNFNNPSNQ